MNRADESRSDATQHGGGCTIELVGDREIRITRWFSAPRRAVFEAWTRAEHIARWWDPSGTPLAVAEVDLRPGGAFRFEHAAGKAGGHVFVGRYQEIVPPERLSFVSPAPGGGETLGILVLEDRGGGTSLTLTMRSASSEARELLLKIGVDAGTARTLDNLARFLDQPRGPVTPTRSSQGAWS